MTAPTKRLEHAIRVARVMPAEQQDLLAAELLERIQDLSGPPYRLSPEGRAELGAALAEAARKSNRPVDEIIAERAKNTPAGRVGDPFEFGEACGFLCAASSGFIVGQNLLLDGGAFNSTMG